MERQTGLWRCPECRGTNMPGEDKCSWPRKGSPPFRFELCPGVRPNPNRHAILRGRMAGRGIGNRPAGWHPPEK